MNKYMLSMNLSCSMDEDGCTVGLSYQDSDDHMSFSKANGGSLYAALNTALTQLMKNVGDLPKSKKEVDVNTFSNDLDELEEYLKRMKKDSTLERKVESKKKEQKSAGDSIDEILDQYFGQNNFHYFRF